MEQTPPMEQPPPLPSSATPPLTPSSAAPTSLSSPASPVPPPTPSDAMRSPNPTLNPTTKSPALQIPHSQRPQSWAPSQPLPSFSRSWQQASPFQHFSLPPPPGPHSASAASTPSSSPISMPPPRVGIALGVPAHHTGLPPPASFSSLAPPSFCQQYGGLGRNVPDSVPASSSSQVRQPIQGMQGMGIIGALGPGSPLRAAGVTPRPLRSISSSLRGHIGCQSPSSQSQNQPWLSSAAQGKPPLPPPSLRPQMSQQLLPQRSHIPPQHHHTASTPQPASSSGPSLDTSGQQNHQPSRNQLSLPYQSPIATGQGPEIQRPSGATLQSGAVQAAKEIEEPCNRIMSKRSIRELVTQIDPSGKLDPEVEDILVDIAEDFVESITTFGCSLAKHRKSSMLESKDIILNVERNWNISLPGFSGDEIRTYKKPFTTDIHRERLAIIKQSIVASEATNSKSRMGKGATNILSPPNAKT